ncbi:MAG: hypothetical protein E6K90_07920 [Thaumarchaeota archaeon]|nr:MAG: hypothetical protein E6K90_07920 [Nitrososphaerota archaeon]
MALDLSSVMTLLSATSSVAVIAGGPFEKGYLSSEPTSKVGHSPVYEDNWITLTLVYVSEVYSTYTSRFQFRCTI